MMKLQVPEEESSNTKTTSLKSIEQDQPLLQDNPSRFVLFPINFPMAFDHYKMHLGDLWTLDSIKLDRDVSDWKNKLTLNQKTFVKSLLALFASQAGIVFEDITNKFSEDVQVPEIRCFYGFQVAMENMHTQTYSLLINTYIPDQVERNNLLKDASVSDVIKKKALWASKWLNDDVSFQERVVAFAAAKEIFFSGPFCSIFWLKKQHHIAPGLTGFNELIFKDHGRHTDFACLIYSLLKKKLTKEKIHEIISTAVAIETEFVVTKLFPNLIGIDPKLMVQYVQHVADRLICALGAHKLYHASNPFDWMKLASLRDKQNLTERKMSASEIEGGMPKKGDRKFSLEEDF